ncbi:MAG: hypothetical protein CME88_05460 [Hirschia sp.]|nr:hypothetical protein [Hirschia sp.]MBF17812.1 hypothetical protein [Hirschia sp.]
MKLIAFATIGTAALLSAPAAIAQAEWSGEGSLSAGYTTGNTETTDAGAGLKATRDALNWRQSGEFSFDYGETDGAENKNRLYVAGQLDRKFENPRWTAYGRSSYEKDEFSGYENRIFVGGGVGYKVLMGDIVTWTLEGGPGYKIDEVRDRTVNGLFIPGQTEESVAFRAGSRFAYNINDNVTLSNDTDIVYAEVSTQLENTLALTATLYEKFSVRFSYDVRHETEAPVGTEDTDTATRISLVYGFGK